MVYSRHTHYATFAIITFNNYHQLNKYTEQTTYTVSLKSYSDNDVFGSYYRYHFSDVMYCTVLNS